MGPVGPLVDVVTGLELAGVGLGQDVEALEPLHGRDGVPVRDDQAERGAVVASERLPVHLVGDKDPRAGSVAVPSGRERVKREVVLVGLGQDRLQVVGPVVGAPGEQLDPVRRRLDHRQDLVQEGAGPAGRGDGEVTPGLPRRQWPHVQAAVAGALEGDRVVVGGQRAQVVEAQGRGGADRATDLQRAVVRRDREVAAHVVEVGGRHVRDQRLRWRLGVVRRRVDHHEGCAVRLEVVCDWSWEPPGGWGHGRLLRSRRRRRWARGRR